MRNESGQMLVEVLIALGLFVIIMAGVIIFFFNGQLSAITTGKAREALGIARNGIEATRFLRDVDWINMLDGQYGLQFENNQWQFNGTSDTTREFTRVVYITTYETNIKQIVSRVTWQDDRLGEQEVKIATLLSDWQNAPPPVPPGEDPEDPGGGPPIGNWTDPQTLGSIDLGPGNSATDLDVLNKIVFMSASAASKAKPDFYIIDATDGQNPVVISELSTGYGLNSIDVSGDFAYVAHNNANISHLQVINVSDIYDPSLASSFYFDDAGEALIVFYSDDRVYIGTDDGGLYVVDVSSPYSPRLLGNLSIGASVNSIYIKDNKAYIATSISNQELVVVDVSNPASMLVTHTFDVSGAIAEGRSVYIYGQTLYLGLDGGGWDELQILNISDLNNIQTIGTADIGADLNDLRIRGRLVFLATSLSNNEFQVWDISDPTTPSLSSSFNFPQVATGIDYEDNLVYISVRSNNALRIITSGQ